MASRASDWKRKLYAVRAKRVRPGRDEKILASWNGLMLRAVAEAARAFDDDDARSAAIANGEFLFREMVHDGRVMRSHKDGVTRIAGFLEDHAAVGLGALSLYELTFDAVWLDRARTLAASITKWFWDDDAGAFYDTATDHEELLTRPMDLTDNATPAGASLACDLFLRLGDLLGDADLTRRATAALRRISEPMGRYPLAFGHALTAADMIVFGATEVAIAGDPASRSFKSLAAATGNAFVPGLVVAGGDARDSSIVVLKDKPMRESATAYVCRRMTCGPAISDADELRASLSPPRND